MQCHHITPKERGGDGTFDNLIPLCLNCHSEVQGYNEKHPVGTKYRPEELCQRRDLWYEAVKSIALPQANAALIAADSVTFEDLMSILPSNGNIAFLRTNSFGSSMLESCRTELYRFTWERCGPEHEFLDQELETLRQELLASVNQFLHTLGVNTFVLDHKVDMFAVPSEWEIEDPKRYWGVLKLLGNQADAVCAKYDALVRMARIKLA